MIIEDARETDIMNNLLALVKANFFKRYEINRYKRAITMMPGIKCKNISVMTINFCGVRYSEIWTISIKKFQ